MAGIFLGELGVTSRNFKIPPDDGNTVQTEGKADRIASRAFQSRFRGKAGGFSSNEMGDIRFANPQTAKEFLNPLNALSLAIEQALDAVGETPILHK
ncbi:MAG: hypothetical protein WAV40_02555 [Microgenomates group bacterium]